MVSFLEEKKERESERESEKLDCTFFFFNPCCDFYLISIFLGNKKLTFLFEFVFFLFIGLKGISKVL